MGTPKKAAPRKKTVAAARSLADNAAAAHEDRAAALLALVDATPEEDAPEAVLKATLALPDGAKLDVDKACTKAILDAATLLRRAAAAKAAKRGRGRTVSPDEQVTATAIAKAVLEDLEAAHRAPPSRATMDRMARRLAEQAHTEAPSIERTLSRQEVLLEGAYGLVRLSTASARRVGSGARWTSASTCTTFAS